MSMNPSQHAVPIRVILDMWRVERLASKSPTYIATNHALAIVTNESNANVGSRTGALMRMRENIGWGFTCLVYRTTLRPNLLSALFGEKKTHILAQSLLRNYYWQRGFKYDHFTEGQANSESDCGHDAIGEPVKGELAGGLTCPTIFPTSPKCLKRAFGGE